MHTHCCFCSMQCGLVIENKDDDTYKVKPSKSFPVATGRLCQKGLNAVTHTQHDSRITRPLQRENPEDDPWMPRDWNHAMISIAERITSIQSKYGHDAVAVYGGGSLTNEVSYLLGKFTRVALQSRHIDYNGRYCMSSAATAANQAFGLDRGFTFPLSDISKADYIILAGTNIAECQPTMVPYLLEAKKRGAMIVTIDPRYTLTTKLSDIDVRLRPGFDAVFVNGLLHVIVKENLYDHTFVQQRTQGFESLVDAVEAYTPDRVEALTGILPEVTRTIARGFAQAKTGIVLTARGVEQQTNGVDNTLNYINLSLVTGKIGKNGCGFGAVTGQGNGQGGREHGQKADQLPGYRLIDDPTARQHVADVWGISPDDLPGKGVSAYEMIEKIDQGKIKAMIVLGSNPVVSSPNNHFVKQALQKLDLLVVIDMFETETAQLAHWLLPGSSFLEGEGTMTNLEGRVIHRPQVFGEYGDSMQDYQIICQLAKHLGKGQYFQYDSIEAVFDELCRASAGGKADYSGISYDRLKKEKGVYWPCPSRDHAGSPLLFTDRFYHSDGMAKLTPITPKKPAEVTTRAFPYVLTTGRLASHYLSGVQTRRTAQLNRKAPVPLAEIHPWLAKKLKIGKDQKVKLTSLRGEITLQVKIHNGIHPRTIFVPFHWGGALSINQVTNDALDPQSRMPEFKICAVNAERAD
ncbi:molybdopterin oxidoreductase family protein [Caldalkalibacillus salinus]|uniref:molybdopterin oxidoreductase family protein n=1 Tax=Caldalkalibacillus salinus TaxID=2803787 RepID=UPI0019234ACB|nr:molybdopterin oxidoreductase family protein [Caldalkalibacillus salinus]